MKMLFVASTYSYCILKKPGIGHPVKELFV